jgi:hypothetical protein
MTDIVAAMPPPVLYARCGGTPVTSDLAADALALSRR